MSATSEDEAGFCPVIRLPSAIAHDLARSIDSHIESIELGFSAVQARASNIAGTIHLAGPGEFLNNRVVPALASLMAHDIRIRIHLGGKEKIYALLNDGTADLAITASCPEAENRALGYEEIESETFVLVAAPAWVRRNITQPITSVQLLTLPLIAYDRDLPLIRQYFKQVFSIQIDVQAAATVGDLRMVRSFLQAEQGYSVLPKYLCQSQLKDKTLVLLHQPSDPPTNRLYLVWNRSSLRHPRVVFARERLLTELQRG